MGWKTEETLFAASDMYQLLSRFCFTTTPEVAGAVADESLANDVRSILADLEFGADEIEACAGALEALATDDADALFHEVRRDYTHLFTNPHFSVMTPYEARFVGAEAGAEGAAIPLGASLLDVEERYRKVGFQSAILPKERADHMGLELEFMQVLLKNQGICLREGDDAAAAEIAATAESFVDAHLRAWALPFWREVGEKAQTDVYRAVAALAVAFFECAV